MRGDEPRRPQWAKTRPIAGEVEARHKEFWTCGKQLYVDLVARYPNEFERID